jgi:hypothetical protein
VENTTKQPTKEDRGETTQTDKTHRRESREKNKRVLTVRHQESGIKKIEYEGARGEKVFEKERVRR